MWPKPPMAMTRNARPWRWLAGLLVLLALTAVLFPRGHAAHLTITNSSNQEIAELSVTLSATTQRLMALAAGESRQLRLPVTGDASYDVAVRFADGQTIRAQIGYVTHGMNFYDTMTITGTEIRVLPSTR